MTPTQLIPARSTSLSTRTTRAAHPVPAPLRALAALALATGVALLTGAPASAHDSIVGTSPEDGAVLDAAPASVAVTLSDVPQAIAPRIIVTNSAGATMLDEEPVITDRSASVELPALENDTYQVAWRVVSSDGHPIQGTYSFTVAAQVAEEPATDPAATPAASDEPAVGETASSTAAADPTSTASTSTDAETTDADEGSSSTALVAGAIVAVLAVALAGLVLVRRRSSLKDES
ncbi:hypothetical protein SAMN05216410_0778 [Sanguibacter gelidistatuariae]|uniref:CopC domain-containing protein n=1 Tax=Sanguibacter gelidistatuariae TaxID=1814289 RepID=A0A1G6H8N2_9MICO|nr:copper resistance CopC family protein [Sanguibacter gelidistatuariae]SDB89786.1 hypothetical protein SAMN05216410_0778 [Sanguibacter gelidistatuariae]